MKTYLINIVKSLENLSKTLDETSILIDKPWALIDSDNTIQKLIFKKDKTLILSKDGQVVMGKWDYLSESKSLLINRGNDIILCNKGFLDEGVMVLKMDGTNNNFFVLANENVIPDLDAYTYLKKLRYKNLNIVTKKLKDGRILEIFKSIESDNNHARVGNRVTIELDNVCDGTYRNENSNIKYVIRNSKIASIIYEMTYKTKNGFEIMIEQKYQEFYSKGENVWINETQAKDGSYKVIGRRNIIVENGKIKKKNFF
jgi:hypothetical protein